MRKRGVEAVASVESEDIADMLSLFSDSRFHVRWCYTGLHDVDYHSNKLVTFDYVRDLVLNNFVLALDLQIYPPDAAASLRPIEKYEEFVDSVCEGVFLYYDCGWFEVYVKDEDRLQKLYDKLAALKAKKLEIKTDENDGRVALNVY